MRGKVIEFWRAVEMFSPPTIPAARPSQRVFEVDPDQPLPWNSGHPVRRQRLTKDQTWRHIVYVGIYPREKVFETLKSVFSPVTDSFEERPSGSSALLAFAVSDEGTMLDGSAVLSACAWATARALDPGPTATDWLDGFGDLEAEFTLQLDEMYLGWEEGVRRSARVLDWTALAEGQAAAEAALGVADLLGVDGIRVRSDIVARRSAEVVEQDFLNSFIADDLARVAGAAARGDVGSALRDYLRPGSELDVGDRVDVRVRLEEVRRATDPDRIPLGRWPASPEHPLALGQQLAVDEATAMQHTDGNLFAVNGPPGTGKTTMLRDLIAALVTERAERLAVEASQPRRQQLGRALQADEDERERRIQAREEVRRLRPWVLKLRARSEWRAHDRQLAADVAVVDARLRETREELRRLEEEVRVHTEAAAELAAAESRLEDCRRDLSHYRELPGAQLPDGEWLEDRQARERQAPWTDVEWNQARTELFLAALGLHRAFLVHAARPMRESLDGAMEILGGNAPPDLSAEAALAAWRTLFLAVPVVSTTFASVSRLFGPLGAEALGWLLVDEAGQAAPQNAVGALWRSRRAVIVGDPLQLEPITTIPFEAEQAIRAHYGVEEEWLTGRGSVQGLADRLNRLGTTLQGPEPPVWVGAPLTVHRRCDQPMFDLANVIAYDGLMLDATDPALARSFAGRYPTLPQSKWIDVRSEASHGHWIPAEGAEVDRILTHLHEIGFDFSQVMAIAPFRDVARQLAERARRHQGLRAGTIHTAQGKEADVVILVLGSDPARDGARAWAANRPNLLNVAVSRAKRRLYVVGDRSAWTRHRYFDVLAERLPRDQPRS